MVQNKKLDKTAVYMILICHFVQQFLLRICLLSAKSHE